MKGVRGGGKRGKEEIFTALGGKNIILEKGGGAKISYHLDNIHPCVTYS